MSSVADDTRHPRPKRPIESFNEGGLDLPKSNVGLMDDLIRLVKIAMHQGARDLFERLPTSACDDLNNMQVGPGKMTGTSLATGEAGSKSRTKAVKTNIFQT